jgi:hypothetical protein
MARSCGAVAHHAFAHEVDIDMVSPVGQWRWKSSRNAGHAGSRPCASKYCNGNEKP